MKQSFTVRQGALRPIASAADALCRVPVELGREKAAGIPGARFVLLPGKNHILLEGDPGLPKLFEDVQRFLKG
jgi:hypothetical protein